MSSHQRTNGDEPKYNGTNRLPAELPTQSGNFFAEASLGDFLRIFYRHRRAALIFFAVAVSVTALYVLFVPREYRSEAKLFVRIGRENVGLDATTTLGQSSPVTSLPVSREEEINTVVAILESRGLVEKVVDSIGAKTVLNPTRYPLRDPADPSKVTPEGVAADSESSSGGILSPLWSVLEHLGLKSPLSPREKAVDLLRKHLSIEAAKKSNVIVLSHEGPSPIVSQQIVSKLVDYYLDEHMRMNRTPGAHQFLKEQATTLKTQL
ncbi:MAG TPA: hypothetical protein VHX68_21390, partial [Planctomycetaceae bacterium]|nr:hypothetical protein [Planctomycetaceae bacterium]